MPDKFSKFKEIFSIASTIAKPFVPGGAGSVLDAVSKGLNVSNSSSGSTDAIKTLAADNDSQTSALLALHERLKVVEAKLK